MRSSKQNSLAIGRMKLMKVLEVDLQPLVDYLTMEGFETMIQPLCFEGKWDSAKLHIFNSKLPIIYIEKSPSYGFDYLIKSTEARYLDLNTLIDELKTNKIKWR